MVATTWKQEEIAALKADYEDLAQVNSDAVTKYNPTPGEALASLRSLLFGFPFFAAY